MGPQITTAEELIALAQAQAPRSAAACPRCQSLLCPGWESLPGTFDATQLEPIGSLRDPEAYEPTLEEYHPEGTSAWSPDAPIALGWFPYNRCDVWRCRACERPFLRYTEYGGYYVDERIRELRAEHIVAAPAPGQA
jgi:hypothetical protein